MAEQRYVRFDTALNATLELEEAPLPANLRDASGLDDGALSGLVTATATASRVVVSGSDGKLTTSSVTATELGYVSGVTSAIQTQIGAKEASITAGTTDQIWQGNKTWIAKADLPVSTATQTALDLKADLDSPALTGTPTTPTASATTNTTQVASTAMVQSAIAAYVAAQDVEVFKGSIDCSTNPNYPAADAGHVYRVSIAGKIGGASGLAVEAGDRIECFVDGSASGDQATVGANWFVSQVNVDGAVIGPASATNNNLVAFDLTTGKLVKDSGIGTSSVAKLDAEDQTVTGGAAVTSKDLGTVSSGTTTLDMGDRSLQHYTNNGAHTLAPGTPTGSILLDITNGASAGAITTSGFTKVSGDSFTTTNGHKFRCAVSVGNGGSLLQVQALQ